MKLQHRDTFRFWPLAVLRHKSSCSVILTTTELRHAKANVHLAKSRSCNQFVSEVVQCTNFVFDVLTFGEACEVNQEDKPASHSGAGSLRI